MSRRRSFGTWLGDVFSELISRIGDRAEYRRVSRSPGRIAEWRNGRRERKRLRELRRQQEIAEWREYVREHPERASAEIHVMSMERTTFLGGM